MISEVGRDTEFHFQGGDFAFELHESAGDFPARGVRGRREATEIRAARVEPPEMVAGDAPPNDSGDEPVHEVANQSRTTVKPPFAPTFLGFFAFAVLSVFFLRGTSSGACSGFFGSGTPWQCSKYSHAVTRFFFVPYT